MCRSLLLGCIFSFFLLEPAATFAEGDDSESADVTDLTYKSLLDSSLTDLSSQFENFISDLDDVASKLTTFFSLANERTAINSKIWGKEKISDEKKSILQRDLESLDSSINGTITSLLDKYPIPMFALFENKNFAMINRESIKKKVELKQIRSILNEISRKSEFKVMSSNLPLSCVRSDFLSDKNCIERLIGTCRQLFGSRDGNLYDAQLGDEVSLNENVFSNPSEVIAHLRVQEPEEKKQRIADVFWKVMVGLCGTLAQDKYQFKKANISFAKAATPEWISALNYRSVVCDR